METEDSDDTLANQLFECCEEAYKQGISSSQIYESLFSCVAKVNAGKTEFDSAASKLKPGAGAQLQNPSALKKLENIYLSALVILCLSLIAHFIVCSILNVNPLQVVRSLQEQKCLIPSHQVIMQSFRPIANCSLCSSTQADSYSFTKSTNPPIIELDSPPSREQFEQIAYSSRPIIIRNGGRGMKVPFSFVQLKSIFESETNGVDTVSDECQFLPFRSPFKSLREAFSLISASATWEEPWYVGW